MSASSALVQCPVSGKVPTAGPDLIADIWIACRHFAFQQLVNPNEQSQTATECGGDRPLKRS